MKFFKCLMLVAVSSLANVGCASDRYYEEEGRVEWKLRGDPPRPIVLQPPPQVTVVTQYITVPVQVPAPAVVVPQVVPPCCPPKPPSPPQPKCCDGEAPRVSYYYEAPPVLVQSPVIVQQLRPTTYQEALALQSQTYTPTTPYATVQPASNVQFYPTTLPPTYSVYPTVSGGVHFQTQPYQSQSHGHVGRAERYHPRRDGGHGHGHHNRRPQTTPYQQ